MDASFWHPVETGVSGVGLEYLVAEEKGGRMGRRYLPALR